MTAKHRFSYHKRLFVLLMVYSWTIIACFVLFQYYREKQCKSDVLNAQLQVYNQHLLKALETREDYLTYLASHEPPFEEQRITLIDFDGEVFFDNTLSPKLMDNHINRSEIAAAMKKGRGTASAAIRPAMADLTSILPPRASG